jgi:hypothetical protein
VGMGLQLEVIIPESPPRGRLCYRPVMTDQRRFPPPSRADKIPGGYFRPKSAVMTDDILRVAILTVPCLFGLWTAVACRRAQYHGLPGSDALVWAGLSGVFFLLFLIRTARGLGLLHGFGDFLRRIFRQRGWYEDRRSLQIAASIAVTVVIMALIVWGLRWTWHSVKRYRLAVGFSGLTLGFGIIRFISLHEVDAWNANAPWVRTSIDLVAAAVVSAVAIARLWQLRNLSRYLYSQENMP